MNSPEISIIIRTFNEERHLPNLLSALRRQTNQSFEIIVVDSGSVDRTPEIARKAANRFLRIESRDFTFGYSLNIGIRSAAGRYIAIVSAHTVPLDENWLERLIAPLRSDATAMVYGRQLGGATSKFSEAEDMRRTFGKKRKVLKPPHFFANNANAAVKKELWEQHPFDESLLGLEDIEWAKHWMQRGRQVIYEPDAALYHIHEESQRQVRRRYYREAIAARRIGIKHVRHAFFLPFEEIYWFLLDTVRIWSGNATGGNNLSQRKMTKYAMRFRLQKAIGGIKGLLDGINIDSPAEKEKILFDRSYQAVVVRAPGQASLEKVELPEVKPGDVLLRLAYVAVCATDIEIFEGSLNYFKSGLSKYPIVPGHEFSARVVSVGTNVTHLAAGDPVVVECIQSCGKCKECLRANYIGCAERTEVGVMRRDGGYAEFAVMPGAFVHRLPSDFDLLKACLCEPLAVVLKGIRRLERIWPESGNKKRCAVIGAGPLGHLCALVLAARGHHVTVFDRNPKRLKLFNHPGIDTAEDLNQLGSFDTLVEVTGDPDALNTILHESPAGASILLLGLPYAHRSFTFENIVTFDKVVVGSVGSAAEDFKEAIEILPQLDTGTFCEKVMPLEEYAHAWKLVRAQTYLKIMLQNNEI